MSIDLKIKVRGLKKAFGSNVVLDGIDLDVPRGKYEKMLQEAIAGDPATFGS